MNNSLFDLLQHQQRMQNDTTCSYYNINKECKMILLVQCKLFINVSKIMWMILWLTIFLLLIVVCFSFCFVLCIIRTNVPMVLCNRKYLFRWQAFAAYRSASSGLKENDLIFDIIWKIVILYNIIINLDMRYRCCLPHIDDSCLFYMMSLYFLFLFYFVFNLILFYYKLNEAQMLHCRGPLLL